MPTRRQDAPPPCAPAADRYTVPLPIKNIALLFSLHRNTCARYLREGQIKAKRVGGRWRLHVDELPIAFDPRTQQNA